MTTRLAVRLDVARETEGAGDGDLECSPGCNGEKKHIFFAGEFLREGIHVARFMDDVLDKKFYIRAREEQKKEIAWETSHIGR